MCLKTEKPKNIKKCPVCGNEQISDQDNFCTNCGAKLRTICNCWVKKGSYNCSESSCPGYRLHYTDIKKSNT